MKSAFQRFFLPGLVFQSINLAGGYGTGREIVEFFLRYGPINGLLGLLIPSTILISLIAAIAFELARMTHSYDYRSFIQQILGRAWFLYEIAYLISVALVLAVVGAAIGALTLESFNLPGYMGTAVLLVAIAVLAFKGTRVIEGVMSLWSFVLYAVYIVILVSSIYAFGPMLKENLASSENTGGWFLSGLRYGSLQLALLPAILFATTHIKTRRDALIAGALTGPLYLLPAVMFLFAMVPHYPAIIERPVPINFVLEILGNPFLQIAFPIVLIGTFIETGTGMIHAFNERLASVLEAAGKALPDYWRAITAILLVIGAMLLSQVGLIDLIAMGYGTMTWVFFALLVLPLLTVGLRKIATRPT